ncbi:L-rhamnose mutarotase [Microbacterium sp. LWH7-1.2]|uniref:L-rhamnose mutarotase n=1 Tax=Microbacterium sp. LWH7-1.2 TaxID=3135257 RepID=UPI003138D5E4
MAQAERRIARAWQIAVVVGTSSNERDGTDIQRICFTLQLKPDRVDDYLEAHARVWAEMRSALSESGYKKFSLFVRRDDGLIVAYIETEDYQRATANMALREVNTLWQESMDEYFEQGRPDHRAEPLEQYFHLP